MRYKIILILLIISGLSFGEVNKTATTAGGFLNIEVGAKAIGMGGAFVALADDPTALFWNPSAITKLNGNHFVFNHDQYLADMSFDYIGVVFNLGNMGTLGASVTSLSMDEMKITNYMYPDGTGATFDAGSFAVGGYYAYSLTDRFSIGGGVKFVKETIYNCSAKSVGFDVGTIFTTQFYNTRIGMSISNFGPKMKMDGTDLIVNYDYDSEDPFNNDKINADLRTDQYELPLMFRVGIAVDLMQSIEQNSLWLAIDALHPNDNSECINLGMEYGMRNMFFLRGGYKAVFQKNSEQDWTCGGGLKAKISGLNIRFDYAYQNFGRLENIQKVTLIFGI